MSYEQLVASVDALATSTQVLTDQVIVTQVASDAAVTAAENQVTIAQAAADAAQLSAGIFSTTVAGMAATTVGKYFSVPSADATEYLILYINDVSGPIEIKRYPSANLIASTRLTSGDIFNSVVTYGQGLNGGTLILGSDGRITGLTIPAGQTGNTTYVRAQLGLQRQISNLVGAKITIDTYFDATPNFLAKTTMTTLVMQVLRSGSIITVTPEAQSLVQTGTIIHKSLTYTIQPGDSDVYPVFRPGVSTDVADRSATMKSVLYTLNSQPAGYASWSDYHLQQRLAPMSTTIASNTLTSGEKLDGNLFAYSGESLGGSTKITDSSGNLVGLAIPAGATGATGYISPFVKIDGAKLSGAIVSITAVFTATANFTTDSPPGNAAAQVKRGTSSVNVVAQNIKVSQVGTTITKTFDYTVTAADLAIAPTYQLGGGSVVTAYPRQIQVSSIKYTLSNIPNGVTSADTLLAIQIDSAITKIAVRGPEASATVADTGADFTSLINANNALAGSSLSNPTTVSMKRDEDTLNASLNDYVSIAGKGPDKIWLHHEMPANVLPANIPNQQTLYAFRNHKLENLKITAKNMRYPVHCESGGSFKNGTIEVINCELEHYGNQEAQDYQNSISSGITVWASEHAWGYGASSGQKLLISRSKLKSRTSAFYVHSNLAFDKPLTMRVEYSNLIATNDGGKSVYVQPLGSGQADSLTLVGNKLCGDVYYWMNPWMPNTLEYQPADHCEIKIAGYGNSPAVFQVSESGRALKVQSTADGTSSSIVCSGTGADAMFGKTTYVMPGCIGISGYSYGWADISGTNVGSPSVGNITSLGKRLGNCATVNKVMNVLIDGTTTKTITFNLDYTSVTNAVILASINAALVGLATASEYNIGGRYRPSFTDEEAELRNNSTVGILMGMAVVYDGHHKKVRKMTASDDPKLFAGIAWEDIYPGAFGRVKISGYLATADLLGTIASLSYNQSLYVNPTVDGQLTTTVGTNPILRAIRIDAVEVARK